MRASFARFVELAAAVVLMGAGTAAAAGPEHAGSEQADSEQVLPAPDPHQGYFFSFGAYYGGVAALDPGRGGWRPVSHGPSVSLRVGEALTSWVDIGLDLGMGKTFGRGSLILGHLTAHARWYPTPRWFVHTGLGVGASGGPDPDYADFDRGRYGGLFVLGVGTNRYLGDPKASGGPMLTPFLKFAAGPGSEFTTLSLWLGVEFAWWSGLARDKLDLRPDEAYRSKPSRRAQRRQRRQRR